MQFIATCKLGLESVVSLELKRLGLQVDKVEDARVSFFGDYRDMAKACLWLRTAERVLLVAGSFEAKSFEALYEGVKAIDWRQYIARDSFIHVNGKSAKSTLFSVSDCQRITKKAIVDRLLGSYKALPENGEELIIEVGLLKDQVTLALDCCGAGLSRRGYRTWNVPAPIAETLGAAILLLSHYRPDRGEALIDPMCGSGTMPIEAAMIANNMAVGLNRSFAAEKWHFLDPAVFELAREEAKDLRKDVKVPILGSDIDPHVVDLCKKHAKKAGVMLDWAVRPLKDFAPTAEEGLLVCNPPYGERLMEKREAEGLYRDMRKVFDTIPQWRKSIITCHRDFERIYGKPADKRRKLSNGGMPCTLYQYFVPAGQRKREER